MSSVEIPLAIVAGAGALLLSFLFDLLKRFVVGRDIPISYKIAIIGLPSAGKTTLIAALFEVIQRGDLMQNVRLSGAKTITRANRYISLLNAGKNVGATQEGDTFLFRFSFKKETMLKFNQQTYDVEITDFPGEYTKKLNDTKSDDPASVLSSTLTDPDEEQEHSARRS
jgi:hypothetical protein